MIKVGIHGSFFGDNFGDTLFAIITNKLVQDNCAIPVFWYCCDRVFLNLTNAKRGFMEFLLAKKIVFTGGGYLGEPSDSKKIWHLRFIIRHGFVMAMCIILKKDYIVVGVGVGPITNRFNRFIIKKFLINAKTVVVRDHESYEFVTNNLCVKNAIEGSDLVVDYIKKTKIGKLSCLMPKKRIGLHIPSNLNLESLKYLVSVLSSRQSEFEYIFFKDFYKPNIDSSFCNYLVNENIKFSCYEYANADAMIKFIRSLDGLVTVKLHVGIVATSFGIPTLSVSLHQKTERYFKQIGYPELNCSFSKPSVEVVNNFFHLLDMDKKIIIPSEVVSKSSLSSSKLVDFLNNN